jgi:hypothetical protein
MDEVRSNTIVPMAFYCFILGVYFLSLATNAIACDKSGVFSTDLGLWVTVLALLILTGGVVAVGIGILYLKQFCWKVLFFGLTTSVSLIASLIVIFLFLLFANPVVFAIYYHIIQNCPGGWFAFISFFLSEIIILYYLASQEVISYFGE